MSTRKPSDLERLTQPGGRPLPDDETIPVLTERLTLPSLELDISLPPAAAEAVAVPPPAPAPAPSPSPPPPPPAPAPAPPPTAALLKPVEPPAPVPAADVEASAVAEIDWAEIEERARDALLRELQPRLAAELDRQLRERLQPTLVRMLLATLTELRPSLEAAVRDAVARAVAAEVYRHRGK